ncbi:AIPR family protein [Microbacterium esteraromaticum]|uniref:AIPR family protein n=1 Tax=Microbacterium esteraromaticum TaxID=57043 RepID=UPI002367B357|nr:AIPR family protein [Microbacterium esteraromaticum]WDH79244.1 AIPR family protein [Microbacterium esteraromaticum]
MGVLQLRQLATNIENAVGPHIDVSDAKGDVDMVRRSRGLAAWTLMERCRLQPEDAATAVTDGFNDQGIDAAWVDQGTKTIFLVQSKWSSKGTGSISAGDMHKFLQGVRNFVNAEFGRFNAKFQDQREHFEAALEDLDVHITLLVVHSGADKISADASAAVSTLLAEMNDPIETVTFEYLSQKELHNILRAAATGRKPDVDATLYDWGAVEDPYRAFYGQVSAQEVASWYRDHGTNLLASNIRQFLGDSEVNASISDTLLEAPEHFWYLNNGITVLCDSFTKAAAQGASRKSGRFRFSGVSIVNGAQTVGCLATMDVEHAEKVADARVTVRFISLEGCPPGFAQSVTRGTNTQNRVERRDFVSLDPLQDSLAVELNLSGIRYVIKSGAETPAPVKGFTITDATVALACANENVDLSTQAKREVGRLWIGAESEDTSSQYRRLFDSTLSAQRLWRSVQLLRAIDGRLANLRSENTGRSNLVAVHGNRLIAHVVYSQLDPCWPTIEEDSFAASVDSAKALTSSIYKELVALVDSKYEGNYLASLFKNATKCRHLAEEIQTRLNHQ